MEHYIEFVKNDRGEDTNVSKCLNWAYNKFPFIHGFLVTGQKVSLWHYKHKRECPYCTPQKDAEGNIIPGTGYGGLWSNPKNYKKKRVSWFDEEEPKKPSGGDIELDTSDEGFGRDFDYRDLEEISSQPVDDFADFWEPGSAFEEFIQLTEGGQREED